MRGQARHIMSAVAAAVIVALFAAADCFGQTASERRRRMTPVDNPSTVTQSVNETLSDTARVNAARRAVSTHYHDENGNLVYVDTITGETWIDSTAVLSLPKMKYPLFESVSVGLNIWDPVMRIFGQDYGLADARIELSLHNRYKPVFEMGLGQAKHRADDNSYVYHSPMSVYFRLGCDYNFLYNSTPDYQFFGGLRYGFSPFKWSLSDVKVDVPYWDETATFDIPSQNATAGWLEVVFGLKVKLWGPISAGWTFKYHKILHESKSKYGEPWYIPGYGSRSGAVTGSFSIIYTLPFKRMNKADSGKVINTEPPTAARPQAEPTAE